MHATVPNPQPKVREVEYLGEVDFVSSNQDVASVLSGFNKINEKFGKYDQSHVEPTGNSGSYHQHNFGGGKPCGMPKKVEDTLVYKYDYLIRNRSVVDLM